MFTVIGGGGAGGVGSSIIGGDGETSPFAEGGKGGIGFGAGGGGGGQGNNFLGGTGVEGIILLIFS